MKFVRLCIGSGVSEHKERCRIIICGDSKRLAHRVRVKMHDPTSANTRVMCRQHHVGRDDRGIHRGRERPVIFSHPAFLLVVANEHGSRSAKVALGASAQLFNRRIRVEHKDPLRLIVTARGRKMSRRKDAVNDRCGKVLGQKASDRIPRGGDILYLPFE